jgi:hypothetical protein
VGSEEGVKCGAVFGKGGVVGAAAACAGGGSGGAWSGLWRKKKVGPADRAYGKWRQRCPVAREVTVAVSVRGRRRGRLGWKGEGERWAAAGLEGKGGGRAEIVMGCRKFRFKF